MNETSGKLVLLRKLAASHGLDAILLQRTSSVAWATGGAAVYINTASTNGEASLLITEEEQFLLTNNSEATRLEKEEGLVAQGWEFCTAPWFETDPTLHRLTGGLELGADASFQEALDLSGEIACLRANLTSEEGKRFRTLGKLCAQAMDAAARSVHPGHTEYEIAALLDAETQRRGVQPIVNLIATDERIFNFRHPLPTSKKLDRYAMLILCGRQYGLVCSISRLIHFGQLPDGIRQTSWAVAQIDAAMIAATRPGRSLGDVFRVAMQEYARCGYPDEWRLHHQGGLGGYEPREFVGRPGATEKIAVGQVCAWNPTITGSKSEDTFLVGKTGNEILTAIPDWPVNTVDLDGVSMERPAILTVY